MRRAKLLISIAVLGIACSQRQESDVLVDVEPERLINTDLSYPKNPERWVYVTSRVSTAPQDLFPGYRIVLVNPFGARAIEENRETSRGTKLVQLVHEIDSSGDVMRPGKVARLNLIVQDPERYRGTGGWGYASYDGDGKPIAINPGRDCMSCHRQGPISLTMEETGS